MKPDYITYLKQEKYNLMGNRNKDVEYVVSKYKTGQIPTQEEKKEYHRLKDLSRLSLDCLDVLKIIENGRTKLTDKHNTIVENYMKFIIKDIECPLCCKKELSFVSFDFHNPYSGLYECNCVCVYHKILISYHPPIYF